eukprot:gene17171-biopygen6823
MSRARRPHASHGAHPLLRELDDAHLRRRLRAAACGGEGWWRRPRSAHPPARAAQRLPTLRCAVDTVLLHTQGPAPPPPPPPPPRPAPPHPPTHRGGGRYDVVRTLRPPPEGHSHGRTAVGTWLQPRPPAEPSHGCTARGGATTPYLSMVAQGLAGPAPPFVLARCCSVHSGVT